MMRALLAQDPLYRLFSANNRLFLLHALFFLSGAGGLAFEVLCARLYANIAGSTAAAMAAVFAVFILALSAGSWLGVRVLPAIRRPLVVLAGLNLAAGLLGRAAVWALLRHGDVMAPAQALALIALAAVPMGMSFPVIISSLTAGEEAAAGANSLYALNTAGGALGALACGFWWLWAFGVSGTANLALALYAVAALLALRVPQQAAPAAQSRPAPDAPALPAAAFTALAFLSGFLSLAYELLWGRLAKFYLGDRTLATAALLAIYLTCLALGCWLARRAGRRWAGGWEKTVLLFAALLSVAAALHLAGAGLAHSVISGALFTWLSLESGTAGRLLLTLLAMGPAVIVLGAAFPALLQASEAGAGRPGRFSGTLFAANALGAALGAVAGGLWLPALVGTARGFALTSFAAVFISLICFSVLIGGAKRLAAAFGASLAGLLLAWALAPRNFIFINHGETLLYSNEDEYGIQVAVRTPGGLKVRNNRISLVNPLGPVITSYAQETPAYFACLLSRRCESVLNIGTGYGITAGALLLPEGVREMRTIEILPFLVEIQPVFSLFNFEYYKDKRAETLRGDGRRLLASEDRLYDVISVNVLDPYLPGSSSLFTTDFWRLASSRLTPGGAYTQLIQGPDIALLSRGLRSVFPTVLYFPAYGNDFNVVAFAEPLPETPLRLERISGRMRAALKRLGIEEPAAFFKEAVGFSRDFERDIDARPGPVSAVLHTDDRPVLEYRWPQGNPAFSIFDSLQAEQP